MSDLRNKEDRELFIKETLFGSEGAGEKKYQLSFAEQDITGATFGFCQNDIAQNTTAKATFTDILTNYTVNGERFFSAQVVDDIVRVASTPGIKRTAFTTLVGGEQVLGDINSALKFGSALVDFQDNASLGELDTRVGDFLDTVQYSPYGAGCFEYGNIDPECLALTVAWMNMSEQGKLPETITKYLSGQETSFNKQPQTLTSAPSTFDIRYYLISQKYFDNRANKTSFFTDFVDRTVAAGKNSTYAKTVWGIPGKLDADASSYASDDLTDAFCAIYDPDGIQTGPTTNLFNLTINPNLDPEIPPPYDPTSPPNEDNSTLYDIGICTITGIGDVNTASGNIACANNQLANGIRPGAFERAYDFLGAPLAERFLANPIEATYLVWSPEVQAAATNLLGWHVAWGIPTDPLVLDLNDDGVQLTSFGEVPVLFDIDHDGKKEITGWVRAEENGIVDGIVVMDLNHNGKIDNISETMSEYFNGAVGVDGNAGEKKYANGFAALKSLDSNSDNAFTSADDAWNNVKVWRDLNQDGISQAWELSTLASVGITGFTTAKTEHSHVLANGNQIADLGTYIKTDGTLGTLGSMGEVGGMADVDLDSKILRI